MSEDDEEDDGIDPLTAPTLEEGIRRIIAEKLRERFPSLGLSAKGAAALAGAVVPVSDRETVLHLVRAPMGLAIIPRAAPKKLGREEPPPQSTRRLRKRRGPTS